MSPLRDRSTSLQRTRLVQRARRNHCMVPILRRVQAMARRRNAKEYLGYPSRFYSELDWSGDAACAVWHIAGAQLGGLEARKEAGPVFARGAPLRVREQSSAGRPSRLRLNPRRALARFCRVVCLASTAVLMSLYAQPSPELSPWPLPFKSTTLAVGNAGKAVSGCRVKKHTERP